MQVHPLTEHRARYMDLEDTDFISAVSQSLYQDQSVLTNSECVLYDQENATH